jgi:mRNA interferase MazF
VPKPTQHGEIWWAEIDKRRPVAVASRSDGQGVRRQVTVATITTRIRGIPSEVVLDGADGLAASVVNCDDLATIEKDRLVRRIGRLSGARLADLHRAMRFALAIPRAE